jgi:hypothetical protein
LQDLASRQPRGQAARIAYSAAKQTIDGIIRIASFPSRPRA